MFWMHETKKSSRKLQCSNNPCYQQLLCGTHQNKNQRSLFGAPPHPPFVFQHTQQHCKKQPATSSTTTLTLSNQTSLLATVHHVRCCWANQSKAICEVFDEEDSAFGELVSSHVADHVALVDVDDDNGRTPGSKNVKREHVAVETIFSIVVDRRIAERWNADEKQESKQNENKWNGKESSGDCSNCKCHVMMFASVKCCMINVSLGPGKQILSTPFQSWLVLVSVTACQEQNRFCERAQGAPHVICNLVNNENVQQR